MSTEAKSDRQYTSDHEWAKVEGAEVLVGITDFAVEQLGDITLVNLDVQAGDQVEAGKIFGTIESVKTLSDLFAPVSGKVVRVNAALVDAPELVNEDPWQKAWMVAILPSDWAKDSAELLNADQYRKHVDSAH